MLYLITVVFLKPKKPHHFTDTAFGLMYKTV